MHGLLPNLMERTSNGHKDVESLPQRMLKVEDAVSELLIGRWDLIPFLYSNVDVKEMFIAMFSLWLSVIHHKKILFIDIKKTFK